MTPPRVALLFDLDGTLVDNVYQHVLAWREAFEQVGIELAVWRIHRQIGMSGGLFVSALVRETGQQISGSSARWCGKPGSRFPRRRPSGSSGCTRRRTAGWFSRSARFLARATCSPILPR